MLVIVFVLVIGGFPSAWQESDALHCSGPMAGPDKIDAFAGMFDGRLDVQPPLDEGQLAAVPARRGVFLLSSDGDYPVLLATAANLRARLGGRLEHPDPAQRSRAADLRTITRTVRWKLAGSHFEADWRYLELARRIWPRSYASLLSWRPAWMVHVDLGADFPHLTATRDPPGPPGQFVGPFQSRSSAERFIETVQDAFDLCRDAAGLRRSPRGPRCAYGQMGRCMCPCDGTVSMAAYRSAMAQAAEFAAGRLWGPQSPSMGLGGPDPQRQRLLERMESAARELRFEVAAATKTRLDRLAELDGPAYRHVGPLEAFRFIVVQRSGTRRKLNVFLVNGGAIAEAGQIDFPPMADQAGAVLSAMSRHAAAGSAGPGPQQAGPADAADRWRIGLVARYLFSSDARRGLMLRWRAEMTADEFLAGVAASDERAIAW